MEGAVESGQRAAREAAGDRSCSSASRGVTRRLRHVAPVATPGSIGDEVEECERDGLRQPDAAAAAHEKRHRQAGEAGTLGGEAVLADP